MVRTNAVEKKIASQRGGAKLLRAIESAIAAGWKIEPDLAQQECEPVYRCCALHTLDLGACFFDEAAANRGWSSARAWAFSYGFDGNAWRGSVKIEKEMGGTNIARHRRAWELGRLVRRWVDRRQRGPLNGGEV